MTIRVMLADDHRMFREAIQIPLAAEPDIEVIAEAGTGEETLEAIDRIHPDVLVLDIALPDMNGIETARRALARDPAIRIVALSGYADRLFVTEMLRVGARAYVVKSAGADELIRAIRAVVAGHLFLSPEVTRGMVSPAGAAAELPPVTVLGRREQEVLGLLASGMRSADIAARLGITPATVSVHRRNIKHKLGLGSIAELTRYAVREGLQII